MPMMSLSSLVLGAGWLLVVTAVILSIFGNHLPGIRNLYLEAVGFFLVYLIFGQQKMYGLFFGLILPACLIAALFDSFVWKMQIRIQNQKYGSENRNFKKESWVINMMMVVLSSLGFLIGYAFLR